MGVLAKDKRQLRYIYSSESDLGKKILAYVQSLDLNIFATDVVHDDLGDTVWVEISDSLNMGFDEILATDHPDAPEIAKDGDFDTTGWLKILDKNPNLFQKPIAINGNKAKLISSRADILNFYDVDSAGIEQNPQEGLDLEISSNTEDEDFVPENNY